MNSIKQAANAISDGSATTEDLKFWINHPHRCGAGELGERAFQLMLERIEKLEEDKRGLLTDKAQTCEHIASLNQNNQELREKLLSEQTYHNQNKELLTTWKTLYARLSYSQAPGEDGEIYCVADADLMKDFHDNAERICDDYLTNPQLQGVIAFRQLFEATFAIDESHTVKTVIALLNDFVNREKEWIPEATEGV